MMGHFERTVTFNSDQVSPLWQGDFVRVQEQIDPPLRSLASTAMMAVHARGEMYDSTVTDFGHSGPRADADTIVGAGSITLDLLRYVRRASEKGDLFKPTVAPYDLRGGVSTTLVHTIADHQTRRQCTEALGSARQEQPVSTVAINYVQQRDDYGILHEPTTLNLTAQLGGNKPHERSTFFTSISTDEDRPDGPGKTPPSEKRLTVSASQLRFISLQPPNDPPGFHYLRRWTDTLRTILDGSLGKT